VGCHGGIQLHGGRVSIEAGRMIADCVSVVSLSFFALGRRMRGRRASSLACSDIAQTRRRSRQHLEMQSGLSFASLFLSRYHKHGTDCVDPACKGVAIFYAHAVNNRTCLFLSCTVAFCACFFRSRGAEVRYHRVLADLFEVPRTMAKELNETVRCQAHLSGVRGVENSWTGTKKSLS